MSYFDIQSKIKSNKNLTDYDVNELNYVMRPVGKALYKGRGRPRKEDKAQPSDRVKCSICSKVFVRSGRTNHNNTEYHKVHSKMNKKLRELLIN